MALFLKIYAPVILIGLYVLFIGCMFLFKKTRHVIVESHKEKSNYSWVRLTGTILVSSAVIIIFAQILSGQEPSIAITISMITMALGGKYAQKKLENGGFDITATVDKDE